MKHRMLLVCVIAVLFLMVLSCSEKKSYLAGRFQMERKGFSQAKKTDEYGLYLSFRNDSKKDLFLYDIDDLFVFPLLENEEDCCQLMEVPAGTYSLYALMNSPDTGFLAYLNELEFVGKNHYLEKVRIEKGEILYLGDYQGTRTYENQTIETDWSDPANNRDKTIGIIKEQHPELKKWKVKSLFL